MHSGEKCVSHDDCFKRLYDRMEAMDEKSASRMKAIDEKFDRFIEELRARLHDGDLRFVQLEMRLARCEEQLKTSSSGRQDVGRKVTGMLVDLVKMAILGMAGAAAWAVAHGYRG